MDICDEIEDADRRDKVLIPERLGQKLATAREIEETMLQFASHLLYTQARPDKQGQHAVLLMNYLPDLPDTLSYHFTRLGWRWHPEKALVKQRRIVGGGFQDLVAYVPVDEPDDPIVVQHPDVEPPAPSTMQLPWSGVKPKVNIIDEKRPDDES